MGVRNRNSTSYVHPDEPNLLNLHKALEYNANGEPAIRTVTNVEGDITITGDVNIPGNVEISNDTGNPVPVSANTTANSASNPIYTSQAAGSYHLVKYTDRENLQLDATDRLRVSQAFDSWWYAPTVDKDGDFRYIESYSGTGAGSTFVQNLASISLSSGADANGTFTRISRKRHKMRPTTSIRTSFSINWNGYDANVTKRAGLFTDFNGCFFQVNSDLSIVLRRRLADGTLVEKSIARSAFSHDPLDGTVSQYNFDPLGDHTFSLGISGYLSTATVIVSGVSMYNVTFTVADCSKFFPGLKGRITGVIPASFNQVCMVAQVSGTSGPGTVTVTMLQPPGVFGSIGSAVFTHDYMFHQLVFGFDFNGNRNTFIRFFINGMYGRQVIHIEDFGDTLSTPWENAPAVSTRYEVFNTAAPGYRPSFLVSSETVTNEAPPVHNLHFSTAANNNYLTYLTGATAEYPVVGVALRAGEPYQRADLQIQSIGITDLNNYGNQNTAPATFFWRLVLNPTIEGTVPGATNVGKASRMWSYTTGNTVTGGITLISGYCQSHTPVIRVDEAFKDVNLGSNIAYDDSDKIVLVVKQLRRGSNDAQLIGLVNFAELL